MTNLAIARDPTQIAGAGSWDYRVLDVVDSTNTYAARLPPWTAIRAKTQTAGRGRRQERCWVSDVGGLWLSAVLPCPGLRRRWEVLPLAIGWAVVDAVHALGVTTVRLRWPNDVMVGAAKLAGLLVERYTNESAVVGIGLNVFNFPERSLPALVGRTARLADLIRGDYSIDDVAAQVLRSVRKAHNSVLESGFGVIAADLNRGWEKPRRVKITLEGEDVSIDADFHGIDPEGRLRITRGDGAAEAYDAAQVVLLRET